MQIRLAYGQNGLIAHVPDDAVVLHPDERPGLAGESAAILQALRRPIGSPALVKLLKPNDSVVVVFSDITRPMPNARVLPVLLAELERVVPRDQILLLNALGTHRPNSTEELAAMLGADIVRRYRIAQHDAWDAANLVAVGRTEHGHDIMVNKSFYESTIKLLTGFIEPHFFAGFSGGPKAVLPGVAGIDSIMDNHGCQMLADPAATWGRTSGNPVWEDMREAASMTQPSFLLNLTINRHHAITGVYAGELEAAHARGAAAARESAMVPVAAPFDVVLTTNSGYPLDINLYQAVKGMSCAAQIVKPGGSIVIAAECRDGIPEHGEYGRLVQEAGSVAGILEMVGRPGFRRQDQWQAQLQARILERAEVYVYSEHLSAEEIRSMLFRPCDDIGATIEALLRKHGPEARLCVLPEGPQTIPYLTQGVK